MKKQLIALRFAIVAVICCVCTACPEPDEDVYVLRTNYTSYTFDDEDDKLSVEVTANQAWNVTSVPDFLKVNPMSGDGKGVINIEVKEYNYTTETRQGKVVISGLENGSVEIIISQESSLAKDCEFVPTDILELSEEIVFAVDFGRNVRTFRSAMFPKSEIESYTEVELSEYLEENCEIMDADDSVYSWDGLSTNTDYAIVMVGYDKNGDRGPISISYVKTKGDRSKEPLADLNSISINSEEMIYEIEVAMNIYASKYYCGIIAGKMEDVITDDTEFIAWHLWKNGLTDLFVHSEDGIFPYNYSEDHEAFQFISWAVSKTNELSGYMINYKFDLTGSSAAPQKAKKSAGKCKKILKVDLEKYVKETFKVVEISR